MPNCPSIDDRPRAPATATATATAPTPAASLVDRSPEQPLAPPGHVGPLRLAGSGRLVWWTGRVAIGLRHDAAARAEPCRS